MLSPNNILQRLFLTHYLLPVVQTRVVNFPGPSSFDKRFTFSGWRRA